VFLGGHEEGGDGSGLVPLGASEAGSAEDLSMLFTMFFKGVAEEGGEFVTSLMLVLVVLLGFDRRGARRSARGVGAVRWVALLGTPKLASTDGLDVRKSKVLVVVQVVDLTRIWSYAVRRARLLEDLRVARMTDRKTSSMVSAPMYRSKGIPGSPFGICGSLSFRLNRI